MHHVIYALIAPSGGGKSTLIQELMKEMPGTFGIVKSTTTRPRRPGPEDELFYHFVDDAEFDWCLTNNLFVQHVRYGGNRYGTDQRDIASVFNADKHGICAMTEQGVLNVRNGGYEVAAIRIVPTGPYAGRDEIRARDDAARAKLSFVADIEFENSFEPGGLAKTLDGLMCYVNAHMLGLAKRSATP
jgi:guanylate kinase